MDALERQERAKQLREEMRSERNRTGVNQTSASIITSSRIANAEIRSDSENARGYAEGASGNTEDARGDDRGIEGRAKRSRSDSRRFEHDSSESPDGSRQTRRVGLERGDIYDPLIEPLDKPLGTARREQVKGTLGAVKNAIFRKSGSTLTKKEADEYYEPLKAAIIDNGASLDQLIAWKTGKPLTYDIWGNITEFEAESLAKIMIKRGMDNPQAASIVRKFIDSKDYITVCVMMVPRVQMTVEVLRATEREKRETKH